MGIWDVIPNNFTMIAKGVAMQYLDLNARYIDSMGSKQELILTAGLCQSSLYISKARLLTTSEYLAWCSESAANDGLDRFAVTLEALLFRLHGNMNARDVIEIVYRQADLISRTVRKTLDARHVKPKVCRVTDWIMTAREWEDSRNQIKAICQTL